MTISFVAGRKKYQPWIAVHEPDPWAIHAYLMSVRDRTVGYVGNLVNFGYSKAL